MMCKDDLDISIIYKIIASPNCSKKIELSKQSEMQFAVGLLVILIGFDFVIQIRILAFNIGNLKEWKATGAE